MKRIFVPLMVITIVFSSCEKIVFKPDQASSDPLTNFDYLWEELDKKYSYFELKNLDWNKARDYYRSRLNANSTEEELFDVLAAMIDTLRDDHSNLFSPFNVSSYNIAIRKPANFNWRTLNEYYMPNMWSTGVFSHDFLDSGRVGYIRYGSFMSEFTEEQMDFLLKRYKDTKGIIFDVRENGGGSVFNVPKILKRFTQTEVTAGYFITRNGPAHSDFSERENFIVTPHDGIKYLNKVVVLCDRGSYSATTLFSLATKAFPNMVLMGDTTGGGGGLPNGGQLPNGWTYRFSVSQLLDLNGKNFAEDGVPPDIQVSFNWNDLTRDEILERAIAEIK